jgi:hypothetical protein
LFSNSINTHNPRIDNLIKFTERTQDEGQGFAQSKWASEAKRSPTNGLLKLRQHQPQFTLYSGFGTFDEHEHNVRSKNYFSGSYTECESMIVSRM